MTHFLCIYTEHCFSSILGSCERSDRKIVEHCLCSWNWICWNWDWPSYDRSWCECGGVSGRNMCWDAWELDPPSGWAQRAALFIVRWMLNPGCFQTILTAMFCFRWDSLNASRFDRSYFDKLFLRASGWFWGASIDSRLDIERAGSRLSKRMIVLFADSNSESASRSSSVKRRSKLEINQKG